MCKGDCWCWLLRYGICWLRLIAVGDKVVKINGKPAKEYDFCESILNGIPELKEKKKTKLTIETASGVKDIIYEKE